MQAEKTLIGSIVCRTFSTKHDDCFLYNYTIVTGCHPVGYEALLEKIFLLVFYIPWLAAIVCVECMQKDFKLSILTQNLQITYTFYDIVQSREFTPCSKMVIFRFEKGVVLF